MRIRHVDAGRRHPGGRVTGVDFSGPLVELARRRAQDARIGNAEFVIADAQTHQFDAGTFDLVISQFGLMFFDDPVAAFTNIRRALRAGGRAVFVSWQGLAASCPGRVSPRTSG
jgi:ubiquinone/menaquinone biosynthesis C-methylase UbiE